MELDDQVIDVGEQAGAAAAAADPGEQAGAAAAAADPAEQAGAAAAADDSGEQAGAAAAAAIQQAGAQSAAAGVRPRTVTPLSLYQQQQAADAAYKLAAVAAAALTASELLTEAVSLGGSPMLSPVLIALATAAENASTASVRARAAAIGMTPEEYGIHVALMQPVQQLTDDIKEKGAQEQGCRWHLTARQHLADLTAQREEKEKPEAQKQANKEKTMAARAQKAAAKAAATAAAAQRAAAR